VSHSAEQPLQYTDTDGQRWTSITLEATIGIRFPREIGAEQAERIRAFMEQEIRTMLSNEYTGSLLPWQLDGSLSYLDVSRKDRIVERVELTPVGEELLDEQTRKRHELKQRQLRDAYQMLIGRVI